MFLRVSRKRFILSAITYPVQGYPSDVELNGEIDNRTITVAGQFSGKLPNF